MPRVGDGGAPGVGHQLQMSPEGEHGGAARPSSAPSRISSNRAVSAAKNTWPAPSANGLPAHSARADVSSSTPCVRSAWSSEWLSPTGGGHPLEAVGVEGVRGQVEPVAARHRRQDRRAVYNKGPQIPAQVGDLGVEGVGRVGRLLVGPDDLGEHVRADRGAVAHEQTARMRCGIPRRMGTGTPSTRMSSGPSTWTSTT